MSIDRPELFRIVLPVRDTGSAAAFYERLLGITGRPVGGGRTYYDCGQVILALLKGDTPLPDNIYFAVSDLESVFERAEALDCLSSETIHGQPAGEIRERPWGERSFYVRDASGNGLCFVDKQTLFTGSR